MSFRSLSVWMAVLLLLIGAAVVGLSLTDRTVQRAFKRVQQDAASIPAVDGLSLTLLGYDRLSYLAQANPASGVAPLAHLARQRAQVELDELKRFISSDEESRVYQGMEAAVRQYFEERAKLAGTGLTPDELRSHMDKLFDAALARIGEYRAFNLAQVDDEKGAARHLLRLSRLVQFGLLPLLVLAAATLVFALHWGLDRPLAGLRDSMARFAGGEALTRAQPNGASELQSIARSFNQMADRLEATRKSRQQFLASVAHDLRNPLSALELATGPRGQERMRAIPETCVETIQLVHRQLTRLERMTSDLLEAARLEAGEVSLAMSDVDLRSLASEVIALYEDQDEHHPIMLEQPLQPVPVHCDPMRIEQVLNNLVNNAIKFSPQGGEVRVRLRAEGEWAHLLVADQGVGIAPEEHERIFEPFTRGVEASKVAPGAGLGLWASRRIVLAHGGRLDFESTPNQGTTFRLELPLLEAHARATESASVLH